MAYITEADYEALYGTIETADFTRLSYDASRFMDYMTTGIDNVKKLQSYPPSGDDVKMCCAKLISLMQAIEAADGFITRDDGTVTTKSVSSISSGSESLSFSNGSSLSAAVADTNARQKLFADTVKSYLGGLTDSNGVNLLYMGRYPNVQ